jgi:hypothetical protein
MLQLEHVLRQVQLLAGDLHHLLPVPRPHVLGRGPPNRSLVQLNFSTLEWFSSLQR